MRSFFYFGLIFLVTCSTVQGGAPEPEHDWSKAESSSEESSWSEEAWSSEYSSEWSGESETGANDCGYTEIEKHTWCPPNEIFLKKKPSCPPDTCESIVARYDCSKAPPPKPGCMCKSGYKRLKGKCVPICDCPQVANTLDCLAQKCNGPNEEFVQEKSTCPGDTCRALVIRVDCSNAPPPQPGCTCKSGYFRKYNSTGPCVPICECPEMASSASCNPKEHTWCPPNEIFLKKKRSCPPDTCESIVARYDCSKAPPPKPGCTCKSGYKRLKGKCVPICDCPEVANTIDCLAQKCNGPNEEFVQEKSTCPGDTCRALVIKVDCSNAPPPQPGCTCKSGYFRKYNSTGPCVPICECPEMASSASCNPEVPSLFCGVNEEVQCVTGCPPEKTCKNRDIEYACPAVVLPCKDACVCKPGYFRNSIGNCITRAECEQCSKPNEFFSCGGACDNECSTLSKQNRTNCPIVNIKCNEKCYCEDGYARDDNGDCIPVDQCKSKPPLICGPNAEVKCEGCPTTENCRQQFNDRACIAIPLPCVDACYCKPGFFKNAIGECVTKAQCDQCSKPNEFFSCGTACDNECKNIQTQNRTNCPIINKKCTEKCYCEDGFARDDKGNCIPVKDCKPPLSCNGAHEIRRCVSSCPPERTCRNKDRIFKCDKKKRPCVYKCVCEPGYFRNAIGECITRKQCDLCSKPHEFYSCGGACDNECKNLSQNRTNCPIRNIVCNKRCYCEDGYARDKKGNCIPIDKCPPPCKDPNEEFVFAKSCPPDTCISLVAKFKCDSKEKACYRCRCKPGFLRPKPGAHCVPICKCPQMADSPDC